MKYRPFLRRLVAIVFCFALSFTVAPRIAFGAGVVSNNTDADLRAALVGGGTVTFAFDGLIVLTNTLVIANNTTVDASDRNVTISGGNAFRLFNVEPGVSLTLKDLTLVNGRVTGSTGAQSQNGGDGIGGAILVSGGTLNLLDCRLWTNAVYGGIGGVGDTSPQGLNNIPNGSGGAARAGAVYLNGGVLNATNSEFTGNMAVGGAGGTNTYCCAPPDGTGGEATGGAIYNNGGNINIENCSFFMNKTTGGRAPYNGNSSLAGIPGDALGGAIFNNGGTAVVANSAFELNGGTFPLPTSGFPGVVPGATASGGAIFNGAGDFIITTSEFSTNSATGGDGVSAGRPGTAQGGAVFNTGQMNVTDCMFTANAASSGSSSLYMGADANGGAVVNGGSLQIVRSLFTQNRATGDWTHDGTLAVKAARGGAVYNTSLLTVTECAFQNNVAQGVTLNDGSGSALSAFGGALFNGSSCRMTNVTLVANTAAGGTTEYFAITAGNASGGSVFNSEGVLALANCTVSGNAAIGGKGPPNGTGSGGGICSTSGVVNLINTILYNNTSGSNGSGSLTDLGHNISSDASCNFSGPGSLNNTDPVLGPLGNYGGPTPTMPLLTGSPAIDGGDSANFPPTDQRGRTRPFGLAPDIGAFESSPPYVISGNVSGSTLTDEIEVAAGPYSSMTDNHGHYRLQGLTAGSHTVTPTNLNYVFFPDNRLVTVGPDQINVDFNAYRWNTLYVEGVLDNSLHIIYAATNGHTVEILASSNLTGWSSISTNVVGSSNLLELLIPIVPNTPQLFLRAVGN